MMKFTVKGLIALFVTSSALFLTPMRSDAQVNMKSLAEVAKSCQKDVPSKEYYQQMLLNFNSSLDECIRSRYHYSLILDKFPELASTGEILPGYPGSVAVGQIARIFGSYDRQNLLDCIIANDTSSNACRQISIKIYDIGEYRDHFRANSNKISYYLPYICPSCVVAHDEISGSPDVILKAFIKWFLTLDKPQRREVISILGDDDKARQLRYLLDNESNAARREYWEARQRVEQDEKERRRRELLGN